MCLLLIFQINDDYPPFAVVNKKFCHCEGGTTEAIANYAV